MNKKLLLVNLKVLIVSREYIVARHFIVEHVCTYSPNTQEFSLALEKISNNSCVFRSKWAMYAIKSIVYAMLTRAWS